MTRTTFQIAAAALVALTLGCGGFDNQELRVGRVIGHVGGVVQGESLVLCREKPESRDEPGEADDGAFDVVVPAGDSELFVVASSTLAVRVPVTGVKAGEVRDLGRIEPVGGGVLEVSVRISGGVRIDGAVVSVAGTPWFEVPVDAESKVVFAPVPEGDYEVTATVPGFATQRQVAHVTAGLETELELEFETDESGREASCIEHGCTTGLTCVEDHCVSPGSATNVCQPCEDDLECGGGLCQSIGGGNKVCFAVCGTNGACASGFACNTADGVCEPDGVDVKSCAGFNQVGASCGDDSICQQLIGQSGVCATAGTGAGSCTLSCAAAGDCPDGYACEPDGAGMACHPK